MTLFRIAKNLDDDFDPARYGIGVHKVEPASTRELSELYERTKETQGIVSPELEKYLGELASEDELADQLNTGAPVASASVNPTTEERSS